MGKSSHIWFCERGSLFFREREKTETEQTFIFRQCKSAKWRLPFSRISLEICVPLPSVRSAHFPVGEIFKKKKLLEKREGKEKVLVECHPAIFPLSVAPIRREKGKGRGRMGRNFPFPEAEQAKGERYPSSFLSSWPKSS